MKKLLGIVLIFSAISATSAFASSNATREFSDLKATLLDAQLKPVFEDIRGVVIVDRISRSVELSVVAYPKCPSGRACPQAIQQVISAELPIVSVKKDGCGGVVI